MIHFSSVPLIVHHCSSLLPLLQLTYKEQEDICPFGTQGGCQDIMMDEELRADTVMFDGGEPGAEQNQHTAKMGSSCDKSWSSQALVHTYRNSLHFCLINFHLQKSFVSKNFSTDLIVQNYFAQIFFYAHVCLYEYRPLETGKQHSVGQEIFAVKKDSEITFNDKNQTSENIFSMNNQSKSKLLLIWQSL